MEEPHDKWLQDCESHEKVKIPCFSECNIIYDKDIRKRKERIGGNHDIYQLADMVFVAEEKFDYGVCIKMKQNKCNYADNEHVEQVAFQKF